MLGQLFRDLLGLLFIIVVVRQLGAEVCVASTARDLFSHFTERCTNAQRRAAQTLRSSGMLQRLSQTFYQSAAGLSTPSSKISW